MSGSTVEALRALGVSHYISAPVEEAMADEARVLLSVRQELAGAIGGGAGGGVARLAAQRLARVGDEEAWTAIGRHFWERSGYRAACDALGRGDLLAAATSCARANGLSFEEWLAAGGGR